MQRTSDHFDDERFGLVWDLFESPRAHPEGVQNGTELGIASDPRDDLPLGEGPHRVSEGCDPTQCLLNSSNAWVQVNLVATAARFA